MNNAQLLLTEWGEVSKLKSMSRETGIFTSRKQTSSQWSDRTYEVMEVGRDALLNKQHMLDGLSKKYNRHELL